MFVFLLKGKKEHIFGVLDIVFRGTQIKKVGKHFEGDTEGMLIWVFVEGFYKCMR